MRTPNQLGFTIVEALVATAVVGLAGAAFTLALAASGSLRARASARSVGARIALARVGALAARPCSASDTSGAAFADGAVESWSAHRNGTMWVYADSISRPPGFLLRAAGSVPCSP